MKYNFGLASRKNVCVWIVKTVSCLKVESREKQELICQWHGDYISLLASLRGKESEPKNKHERDVGIDGRIVLKKDLTGMVCGGEEWMQLAQWKAHMTMWEISWPAKQLSALQERYWYCFIKFVHGLKKFVVYLGLLQFWKTEPLVKVL